MTLSATVTSTPVADMICSGEAGCFMHGPTFHGKPVGLCNRIGIGLAPVGKRMAGKGEAIESQLREELAPASSFPDVQEVRVLGAIGVIEMKRTGKYGRLTKTFYRKGHLGPPVRVSWFT